MSILAGMVMKTVEDPNPEPCDTKVIICVGFDDRIHIIDHGCHAAIDDMDYKSIEDDCSSLSYTKDDFEPVYTVPGVYHAEMVWSSCYDYESGFDDGCWDIELGELIYKIEGLDGQKKD